MSQATASFRLDRGGLIDRTRPLGFTFDGRVFTGFSGDTLASALIANGVRLVGRSFKYHRPRGVLTAGPEEPNALVELRSGARREPNTRATTTELFDGLIAESQNRWPSLRHDIMALSKPFSPLFVAGFYYKTFMWPSKLWERLYEPAIRRAAGLGHAPEEPDPDTYEKAWAHCDVLVIGAGPTGLAAALAAGRSGARVILCESDARLGGRLLSDTAVVDGKPARGWVRDADVELAELPNVTIMRRTTVFGAYDSGTYGALERVNDHVAFPPPHQPRQRIWRIITKRSVLAAGAIERPIVFPGNDRPGVMMSSAVRSYVNRFAALPGRRFAIFTCNDDGWRTAAALSEAGADLEAIIETRNVIASEHLAIAKKAGARVYSGLVTEVSGGTDGIRSIEVKHHDYGSQVISADCLAMSGGWNPNLALTCHHGSRPEWRDDLAAFIPGMPPSGMTVAGAANGVFPLGACLSGGFSEGRDAAADLGFGKASGRAPSAEDESTGIATLFHVEGKSKAFVDFQNDVTSRDIEIAEREGFSSVEHLKRYTTLGMATDQGKTANVNGLAILATVAGRAIPEVGTTTYRPPVEPVTMGALAGHHHAKNLKPTRLTPSHAWAQEQGAVFVESGLWLRAQWYPKSGEKDWLESVNREVRAVRTSVGVCDVSTLGKIDVQGPDAGVFLDRVYTNTFSTLKVGRARYGLMLREDGFVLDDGTTSRFADDYFFMTTTTAQAGKVMQHLEFARQVLWPNLDVQITSVSDQWAQFSVAGPRSLDVLQRVLDRQHDVSPAALPFLGVKPITIDDGRVKGRIYRISYSGERAYEIAVPARFGDALIRTLMRAGAPFGITPYGTEALNVLRIEKGHVAGNELNGTTTARDLGLSALVSKRKDFIGRILADRPGLVAPDRWDFVGLKPVQRSARLGAGAHIIPLGKSAVAENDEGYMTSVCYSPHVGSWIGLGLISRGRSRIGERVRSVDLLRGSDIEVEICDPVFYDTDGGRQRG